MDDTQILIGAGAVGLFLVLAVAKLRRRQAPESFEAKREDAQAVAPADEASSEPHASPQATAATDNDAAPQQAAAATDAQPPSDANDASAERESDDEQVPRAQATSEVRRTEPATRTPTDASELSIDVEEGAVATTASLPTPLIPAPLEAHTAARRTPPHGVPRFPAEADSGAKTKTMAVVTAPPEAVPPAPEAAPGPKSAPTTKLDDPTATVPGTAPPEAFDLSLPEAETSKAKVAAEAPKAAEPPPAKPPSTSKLAARVTPPSATAELEKSDPRHQSARRFARVAVGEIKLYRESDVIEGRQAKDLWKRLSADIALCIQTYEKRVPDEVRERFDYLYDELLRQLAEGDPAKLGPDAPTFTSPKR